MNSKQITERIETLQNRKIELSALIEKNKLKVSEYLAEGEDSSALLQQISQSEAELSALPSAIRSLQKNLLITQISEHTAELENSFDQLAETLQQINDVRDSALATLAELPGQISLIHKSELMREIEQRISKIQREQISSVRLRHDSKINSIQRRAENLFQQDEETQSEIAEIAKEARRRISELLAERDFDSEIDSRITESVS
jgi:prophage DNA circulation protein